jgi:hypothetical protein
VTDTTRVLGNDNATVTVRRRALEDARGIDADVHGHAWHGRVS